MAHVCRTPEIEMKREIGVSMLFLLLQYTRTSFVARISAETTTYIAQPQRDRNDQKKSPYEQVGPYPSQSTWLFGIAIQYRRLTHEIHQPHLYSFASNLGFGFIMSMSLTSFCCSSSRNATATTKRLTDTMANPPITNQMLVGASLQREPSTPSTKYLCTAM